MGYEPYKGGPVTDGAEATRMRGRLIALMMQFCPAWRDQIHPELIKLANGELQFSPAMIARVILREFRG